MTSKNVFRVDTQKFNTFDDKLIYVNLLQNNDKVIKSDVRQCKMSMSTQNAKAPNE